MGIKDCVITLDNPWNTYYPGQTINGRVDFTFDQPKKVRGISIKFKGCAEVKWPDTTMVGEGQERKEVSIDRTATEEYFSISYYLIGSKTGSDIELEAKTHSFPFTCALPPTLPSSFESEFGFIRYTIKVVLDRPWKFDQETKMAFTVATHLDLNTIPEARNPIHIQLETTFCCCWCKTGPMSVDVRLPVSGYCPGQTIPLDINCENNSGVKLSNIIIKLMKLVTYRCRTPDSDTKEVTVEIAKLSLGSVEGVEAKNFQKIMEIPPLPPSNLVNCGIIDLIYRLEVDCNVSGPHMDMSDNKIITLGTVPLVGFQPPPPDGQTINMLPDVPPVEQNTETPLLSQNPQMMYPPQNMGYPPQNPQYPAQQPYPGVYPPQMGNISPNAPPVNQIPNPAAPYPTMAQPVFRESPFSAPTIHDSEDNKYTAISGNQVFAPRYPTYGFYPNPQPQN